ncbi:MAG: hypothetical protein ABW006_05095 [Hyphomicrobium sp.]
MTETSSEARPLRLITAVLAAIETVAAIFYLVVFHQPGESNAITNIVVGSVTVIILALFVVFVLPAIVLVARNERLELALFLVLAVIPAAAVSVMLF